VVQAGWSVALIPEVRNGSSAEVGWCGAHVRFAPESGPGRANNSRRLSAKFGLMQRSKIREAVA